MADQTSATVFHRSGKGDAVKKSEVEIDHRYRAKVGGRLTVVRITGKRFDPIKGQQKGYDAVNETTGRSVIIKSAAKLREEVTAPRQMEMR